MLRPKRKSAHKLGSRPGGCTIPDGKGFVMFPAISETALVENDQRLFGIVVVKIAFF